tara:strand:- start:193 stop:888 length:696 start_codon:yes stop_codon:yes gene_type:complete
VENASAKTKNIKVSVSYRSKQDEVLNIKKVRLNHPIKISKSEIINHLASLRYQGTSMGEKETSVFSRDELKKIVPILFKAFQGVDLKKIIHFKLKSKKGVTVADIFSFGNYLNWRFDSIHGETFFQKNNARGWQIFSWELRPREGQRFYKSSENKRIHKNWLVAKLHPPVSKTKDKAISDLSQSLEGGNAENHLNEELERKLKRLKQLYEQGLIYKEEYKAQQKKLLEKLF